jgi:hypothetical protein
MAAGTGLPASSTLRGYTAHVQAMIAAIIRHRHVLGTPISAATLTRIRATLRVVLNAAVRRGLLTENPASRAELPKEPAGRAQLGPDRPEK